MEVVELKFLLALLGHPPDYHTALSELRPTESRSDRNRACRQLRDRNLIGCSEEIMQFKTSPSGKALLTLSEQSSVLGDSESSSTGKAKTSAKGKAKAKTKGTKTKGKAIKGTSKTKAKASSEVLPITKDEIKLLKAGLKGLITPGKAMKGTPPQKRQELLQELDTRGLIQAETQIKNVWLTPQGREFLISDCHPDGNHTVSFNFLRNCMDFFRGELKRSPAPNGKTTAAIPNDLCWDKSQKPGAEDVLDLIQALDQALETHNYLPLFHLRYAVQPPLVADELDQILYQLQREDKIELSSLQDAIAYTADQLSSGIPQDIGGPLFFVSLC
ncbi:MAG: hypothetical protein AAGD25_11465 [Cyanobacteria bacterium P01_F01_bin.150]